jgi:ubiquinone/menaquinone biosynthesis C-methylase UbiE
MKKLNLGCGKDIKKGFINLDNVKLKGIDVVTDVNKKLPFKNNEFDFILANDILEHVDDLPKVMKELYRILKPKGVIRIRVPHYLESSAYTDPTHKNFFGHNTFKYFVKGHKNNYYFDFGFRDISIKFEFAHYAFWKYFIGWFANKFPNLYENSFLKIFQPLNLIVTLTK